MPNCAILAQTRAQGGFFDDPKLREHARLDPDLTALRERAEFQKLLRDESREEERNAVMAIMTTPASSATDNLRRSCE